MRRTRRAMNAFSVFLVTGRCAVAALLVAVSPLLHAQIDQALVQKALEEGRKSDPVTREKIEGTLAAYEQIPEAIDGGDDIPARPGHPFAHSPLVSDVERKESENVVIPLMTIFRGGDHNDVEELIKSSEMFENHMRTMPVPGNLNAKYGHIKKCPATRKTEKAFMAPR